MTCPVDHSHAKPMIDTADVRLHTDAVERFEKAAGTVFIALFAGALFDQAMMPAVSAALEDTGRIRNTPWLRALRTAASDQLALAADPVDRRLEAERLVRLHRDVKGVDANGIRYSALSPELWNWILISTFFMYRNAAAVITGTDFTAAENQAVWNRFREMTTDLQLPGRSRLVEDYGILCDYYDQVASEKLDITPTLRSAVKSVLTPPRPDFLPGITEPLWQLIAPVAGHVAAVLGFGIMRPRVRTLVPMTWTRWHDREFIALSWLVQHAYRSLPAALIETPLVRNRRQYERLIAKYNGIGLASFAPDQPTPVG
jgi:uncharacterized protein (DUF2236 family)